MKTLLITGFDPFGGEVVNPSWEAVKQLPDVIGSYRLEKLQIPTVFSTAFDTVLAAAGICQPDVILCIGQAGGRSGITPELVGINLRDARIADNKGNMPVNTPIVPEGPAAYFATVPVRRIVNAVSAAGLPCSLSFSAGAFVCNDVLYSLLHHYHGTTTTAGFIHVPFLPEQAKGIAPSMSLEQIVHGLTLAVEALSPTP